MIVLEAETNFEWLTSGSKMGEKISVRQIKLVYYELVKIWFMNILRKVIPMT